MARDPNIIVLGPGEPDLARMEATIKRMLGSGSSVEDIAASLQIDPAKLKLYADQNRRDQFSQLSHKELRVQHIVMLQDMVEVGKQAYMEEGLPPQAFAVASLIKTSTELMRDIEHSESSSILRDKVQAEVVETCLEHLVVALTKEIGAARQQILAMVPREKQNEALRCLDDVAKAMAVSARDANTEAGKKLDELYAEKKKPKSKSTALVHPTDPRP